MKYIVIGRIEYSRHRTKLGAVLKCRCLNKKDEGINVRVEKVK